MIAPHSTLTLALFEMKFLKIKAAICLTDSSFYSSASSLVRVAINFFYRANKTK